MTIERYSHAQHMETISSVASARRFDRFDALASCFPAGTVTGAPKIRAMEIIDELEPDQRGIYAGAVLYMDYADNLDSCIAIRTMVLRGEDATVQAGAGIVADSVPEHEYAETVNKARAMFRQSKWRNEACKRISDFRSQISDQYKEQSTKSKVTKMHYLRLTLFVIIILSRVICR